MRATTTTELRANLARMMDQVIDDHTPLLITRAGGANAVLNADTDTSVFAALSAGLGKKKAAEMINANKRLLMAVRMAAGFDLPRIRRTMEMPITQPTTV